MEGVELRPAGPQHAKPIISLHKFAKANNKPAFSPEQVSAVQQQLTTDTEGTVVWCAVLDEGGVQQVVGAVTAHQHQQPQAPLQITSFVVRADLRRQGLATALLSKLLDSCSCTSAAECWVTSSPHAALLLKLGFMKATASNRPAWAPPGSVLMQRMMAQQLATSAAAGATTPRTTASEQPSQQLQNQGTSMSQADSQPQLLLRPLDPTDIDVVDTLHRQAKYQGRPVFGEGTQFAGVQVG